MFDVILRKVRFEVELLMLVVIFSTGLSSFLITDAVISLIIEKYGLGLIVIRICQLIFAVVWLSFSLEFIVEVNRLRKKHFFFYFVRRLEKLGEEEKKTNATELVMDMVAFYRGYYVKVLAIMVVAIAVSFLIVVAVTYLLLFGYMSFWVAVFRWALNSLMLLVASVIYLYVHKSWGKKLLKVKDAEKKLSEMLGELIA